MCGKRTEDRDRFFLCARLRERKIYLEREEKNMNIWQRYEECLMNLKRCSKKVIRAEQALYEARCERDEALLELGEIESEIAEMETE